MRNIVENAKSWHVKLGFYCMWSSVVEAYIRRIAFLDWFFLPNIHLLFLVIYLEVADMMFYCETLNTILIITA
jgi:hypothetical protein